MPPAPPRSLKPDGPMNGSDSPLPTSQDASPRRVPRGWMLAAGAGLAGLALLWACTRGRGAGAPPAARPVPVAVAPVRTGDMDLTLTSLGTVTAIDAATVRSRVDGQLMRVTFKEGQLVRQGELLAEIDPRPFRVQLMQAEGQHAKDLAALRNARADLARIQSLAGQGVVSRQQLDTQEAQVAQFEAALRSDQAQVESARLNLTYSRITSPVSGRAGLRRVDPGNLVRASDAEGLVVITPVAPIHVLFTVPADALPQVLARARQGAAMAVEAYDRDLKTRLATGAVAAIDNQVDAATGTVRIKALFPNRDGALFPNQFVNARLFVGRLQKALLVPTAALQRSPQGAYVYVARQGTAELRQVELLGSDGETSALGGALAVGEQVVVEGLEKLKPGSALALPGGSGKGAGRR